MTWSFIPSSFSQAWACLEKDCEPGSDTWASRLAPSSTLSGKLTQPQSWRRGWKKAAWMRLLSGPTFAPSTLSHGVASWIASLQASRAKTSVLQAGAQGLMANARGSSSKSCALPAIAVRGSWFWRTSQASLLPPPPLWTRKKASSKKGPPPESWESWPTSGGMRSGSLFQRPMWEPVTGAPAGSASHGDGWMTPSVSNSQGNQYTRDRGQVGAERPTLTGQSMNWPTPQVGTGENSHGQISGDFRNRMEELLKEPQWSSPRASDGKNGGPNQRGSKGDLMLPSMAAQWPTPDAAMYAGSNRSMSAGAAVRPAITLAAASWPTPAARDYRSPNSQTLEQRGGGMKGEQLNNFVEHHFLHPVPPTHAGPELLPSTPGSLPPSASKKSTTPRLLTRRLNPYFGENLMGWRQGWTSTTDSHASSASETELWRSRLQQRLSCLLGEPGCSTESN